MSIIVADASPLIFLAKLALLHDSCKVFNIVTTSVVLEEATRKGHLPDAKYIKHVVKSGELQVLEADARATRLLQKEWGLGHGEASAFALMQAEGDVLLIDDFAAISAARAQSYAYITTPVTIYELKSRGVLSPTVAREKLIALKDYLWVEETIIDVIISRLDFGGKT